MEILSFISIYGLLALSLYNIIKPLLNKDLSLIWSPLSFVTIIYAYYVLIVYFAGDTNHYKMDVLFIKEYSSIGAFVSYLGVHIAYHCTNSKRNKVLFDNVFTSRNSVFLSIVLLLVAIAGYSAYKGFKIDVVAEEDAIEWSKTDDFEFYFTSLIALGCTACTLLLVKSKNSLLIIISFIVILLQYIISGFRYRIVFLLIASCTMWHLYPFPKKPKYSVLVPLVIAAYLFFGLMDKARMYGAGLKEEVLSSFSLETAEGAAENEGVFSFSGYVIASYSGKDKVYFEPLWCAITLPIPRSLYPDKPDADYVRKISTYEYGGAAFTYYAEAFMAFGWLGVFLYGFFLGWVSKRIWNNYLLSPHNINTVLFLSLFNGFLYVWISRGYLAQALVTLVYFVLLPFWIAMFLKSFNKGDI